MANCIAVQPLITQCPAADAIVVRQNQWVPLTSIYSAFIKKPILYISLTIFPSLALLLYSIALVLLRVILFVLFPVRWITHAIVLKPTQFMARILAPYEAIFTFLLSATFLGCLVGICVVIFSEQVLIRRLMVPVVEQKRADTKQKVEDAHLSFDTILHPALNDHLQLDGRSSRARAAKLQEINASFLAPPQGPVGTLDTASVGSSAEDEVTSEASYPPSNKPAKKVTWADSERNRSVSPSPGKRRTAMPRRKKR